MVIQVTRREGESGEKLLRRFSGHVKTTRLMRKMRKLRYFAQKPSQRVQRGAAISREAYRTENKRKAFLSS